MDHAEMTAPVPAAYPWASNAELIAAVARLGYLRPTDRILDVTYGLGVWWRRWRPDPEQGGELVTRSRVSDPDWDFRETDTEYPPAVFDVVAYDPPYKLNGTDQGEGSRYGVDEKMNRDSRLKLMRDGLTSVAYVVRKGGYVLVKCQDQVEGGKVRWQTDMLTAEGDGCGLAKVDEFLHLGGGRPQPPRTRKDGKPSVQQHPYGRPSTLLIFRQTLEMTA